MAQTDLEIALRYEAMRDVVQRLGAHALDLFRSREQLKIQIKGIHDVVSTADFQVEQMLREQILARFAEDGLVAEEGGSMRTDATYVWVVDPIDGTTCFVNGMFSWCISVALLHRGRPVAGVVFDPNSGELFHAVRGTGAFVDSGTRTARLRARDATNFSDGVLGVGYSHRADFESFSLFLQRLLREGGMFIRNGSGALMISYVAAGRLIGYYEPHINSWDCLAGIVLAQEAGCVCNDFLAVDGLLTGNPIVVAGPNLYAPLITAIGANDPGAAKWRAAGTPP